ncbi:hypothetical protein GCM10009735_37970 [Actinomadura chokoriensis]
MTWFRFPRRQRGEKQRPHDPPAALALLLPDDLTKGEFANGIQRALTRSRDALAGRARQKADLADREEQDEVHRAYLIGGSLAFSEAVARIDAAIGDVFQVSDQRPKFK